MSWPYVAAAWRAPVAPLDKLLLLALADQADMRGIVSASRLTLERLTGLSPSSVKRAMRHLVHEAVVELLQPSTAAGVTQRHRLHLRDVRVADSRGLLDPGSIRPGVQESQSRGLIEPTPSPSLIPKSRRAQAGACAPAEPTIALLKKLVHEQFEEKGYTGRADSLIELTNDLKTLCKTRDLDLGETWDPLYQAIREVLGARGVPGYARPSRRQAQ